MTVDEDGLRWKRKFAIDLMSSEEVDGLVHEGGGV